MDWRRTILQFYAERSADDTSVDFRPGASAAEIAAVEQRLNVRLPASLRAVLQETNGVMEQMKIGDRVEDIQWLLWPLNEIVSWNEDNRKNASGPDSEGEAHDVLFFADAGADGIQFGFPIAENRKYGPRVVVWHPIDDELTEVAPSLEEFLRGWLSGKIDV